MFPVPLLDILHRLLQIFQFGLRPAVFGFGFLLTLTRNQIYKPEHVEDDKPRISFPIHRAPARGAAPAAQSAQPSRPLAAT